MIGPASAVVAVTIAVPVTAVVTAAVVAPAVTPLLLLLLFEIPLCINYSEQDVKHEIVKVRHHY